MLGNGKTVFSENRLFLHLFSYIYSEKYLSMRKLAIFGTKISSDYTSKVEDIIHSFIAAGFSLNIYKNFKESLDSHSYSIANIPTYTKKPLKDTELLISLGGDGTFLKCAHMSYKTNIPILGINFGKLGFLAQTNPDDIDTIIKNLETDSFSIGKRTLLDFSYENKKRTYSGFGLNEITLQKSNAVKLIKINIYIGPEFLCSFWADGVAICTPTGSTGYSLSLGSPILTPGNNSLIITPIAPHTLSIRPIIIPDSETITIEATGEYTDFLVSNDYMSKIIHAKPIIHISKSRYTISTIEFNSNKFFTTLRKKLNLGFDIRK